MKNIKKNIILLGIILLTLQCQWYIRPDMKLRPYAIWVYLNENYPQVKPKTWNAQESHVMTSLRKVKFINNAFWAVGDSGVVLKSDNGFNWNLVDIETTSDLTNIEYFKNSYYIIGDKGSIFTSNNGYYWSNISVASNYYLFDIAISPDTFAITGTSSNTNVDILISKTPQVNTSWTTISNSIGVSFYSISQDKGKFFAAGGYGITQSCNDDCSMASNWSVPTKSSIANYIYDFTIGNNIFLILTDANKAFVSNDYIAFEPYSIDSKKGINTFWTTFFDGNRFLIFDPIGNGYLSADGITWKNVINPSDKPDSVTSIAMNHSVYVTVGHFGGIFVAAKNAF